MTHDELLAKIEVKGNHPFATLQYNEVGQTDIQAAFSALRAVVAIHRPYAPAFVDIDLSKGGGTCFHCSVDIKENSLAIPYPCPTIQAIEKELANGR